MKPTPIRTSPSKLERRSVALITAAFILISAVLHFALGGLTHASWPRQDMPQRAIPIVIEQMSSPRPTPKPISRPTPRPTMQATQRPMPQHAKPRSQSTKPVHLAAVHPPAFVAAGSHGGAMRVPQQTNTEAPPPQVSATPIDARDIIVSARFIKRVEPEFPEVAIDQEVEGTVIVLVTIGPDGVARNVRVWQSSGNLSLDRAALLAAQQSTYAPPEVNGQPATQTYRVIYTFYLNQ